MILFITYSQLMDPKTPIVNIIQLLELEISLVINVYLDNILESEGKSRQSIRDHNRGRKICLCNFNMTIWTSIFIVKMYKYAF